MSRESRSRLSLALLSLFIYCVASLPSECQPPADGGSCQKSLYRYHYDHASGDCQRFIYTGCGGNSNRFIRRSHCREKCLEGRTPPNLEQPKPTTGQQSLVPMSSSSSSFSTPTASPPATVHPQMPNVADDSPRGSPAPQCSGCDPLFGVCQSDGKCGCMKGYKKAGRICVDLDECELSGVCPETAVCINTLGGFHCNCGPDTKCDPKLDPYEHLTPPPPPSTNPPFIYTPPSRPVASTGAPALDESSCTDPFDMALNENCGVMLPRFYYESHTKECRAVLYGGCKITSKNVFTSRKDCEGLCLKKKKTHLTSDPNSILAPVQSSSSSHSPSTSTSPTTSTRFPPLPWDAVDSTTTSPDPYGLLGRSRSTSRLTTSSTSTSTTTPIPEVEETEQTEAPLIKVVALPPRRQAHLPPLRAVGPRKIEERTDLDDHTTSSAPSVCLLNFDESLRMECITSTWTERFYYDSHAQSCVAFWYDSSCDAKDLEGKNQFKTEDECMKCKHSFDPKKDLIDLTPPLSISLTEKHHFTTESPEAEEKEKAEEKREEKKETEEKEHQEEEEEESDRVEYIHSTSTSTSSPIPYGEMVELEEDDEEERKKTEEAYLAIKNSGTCSGILDTRLEDDCDNGNWEMRYFFSTEKGSCRAFWYGGCKVDAHNFYPTLEACKQSCGTHYPVESNHFNQATTHYEKKEDAITTTTTPVPTTSASTTKEPEALESTPHIVSWTTRSPPIDIVISGEEETTTTPSTSSSPDSTISSYITYPIDHSIKNRGSVSYSTPSLPPHPAEEDYEETEEPPSVPGGIATDPCDDPVDEKLEEECTGWEYRSYYDAAAKKCVKFWYGGCEVASRNLFLDAEACRAVCGHKFEAASAPVITTVASPVTTTTVPSTTSIAPTSAPMRECLEAHSRDSPSRECGKDGKNWTQRYFFDHATRSCRMYWGCEGSSSPNNFPDLLTCQWKCEPQRSPPSIHSCLDPLDPSLEDDCSSGAFQTKYHFDFPTKKCVAFHYGGCRSASRNLFEGVEECKETCERPTHTVSQSCLEPFDRGFLNTCNVNSRFEPKYYYDSSTGKCEMFWWGGCRRVAANFFVSLETCKWSCERPKKSEGPKQCHDKFDVKLTEVCQDGNWRERFYFDHEKSSCVAFWWDGCHSESANFFRDKSSCQSLCEVDQNADIGTAVSTLKEEFRCLEPKKVGECRETYPAYFYDRTHRECRPFSYSGCGGNGNRFLTLAQCEGLCRPFTLLSESESSCYLPLDTGHSEGECGKAATVAFFFDRNSGSCSQFWFRGCGGNGNRYSSLQACNRICTAHRMRGAAPVVRKARSSHGNETVSN